MIDNELFASILSDALTLSESAYPKGMYDLLSDFSDQYPLPPIFDLLSRIYRYKPLSPDAWNLVFRILEAAADSGDADAMNELGALYYGGSGCEQSYAKAVYYYQLAADHGNVTAQENLGYCFYYGRSVPVDYEKAFHYYALGAFAGRLISLYKIGDMYANGYHVPKNEWEAFAIYNRCVDLMTDEDAPDVAGPLFLRMGDCLLKGSGTAPDPRGALIFYQKSEMFLYAMVERGDDYYRGSLIRAVEGQSKARSLLAELLDRPRP